MTSTEIQAPPPTTTNTPTHIANGTRIQTPGQDPVYLVMDGKKCWIPSLDAYHLIFLNWDGIKEMDAQKVDDVPSGPPMSAHPMLVQAKGAPEVYLLNNGMKHHVKTRATMAKYHFDSTKVFGAPRKDLLDLIPTGFDLE